MRILKFGGKSLGTKEKFSYICEFIKEIYEKDKQIIVVVSAIGDTTNKLVKLSETFGNNTSSNAELSLLLSTGETQASALFAMHLNSIGVPAQSFSGKDLEIFTFGDFTNSRIAYINKTKLLECINSNKVAVVAGFQGINREGKITTLGRGGSDTTAVALSSVFNTEAEIYSDFDGVFSGDPRINNYKKINFLKYEFVEKMAESGAKVLDEKAIKIAKRFNTTIISKNSAEPNLDGSIISNIESDNISINQIDDLTKITIVFSNYEKLDNIIKNVLLILNNKKFYNLTINSDCISFFINKENANSVIKSLSEKLKLLYQ